MAEPKAYRIFYRGRDSYHHREEVVYGEAELAHRLKRQRPVAIHHEVAALWPCGVCRKRKPWTRHWRSVPDPKDPANPRYARSAVRACSAECAERFYPGWVELSAGWRHLRDDDREPIPHPKPKAWERRLRARWDAFSRDRDRKLATKEHRKVPMLHEGKPEGWCRWCGLEVPKPRRTWHQECLHTYLLHSDAAVQLRHLVKRDGPTCKAEGCHQRGTDVDHVTPLWSVRDLPDQERLRFYGPDNLQLLCGDCHKEKTAREAGERSRIAAGKAAG